MNRCRFLQITFYIAQYLEFSIFDFPAKGKKYLVQNFKAINPFAEI